eukprot:scaffold6843_cov66-Phaeocystis_antarctica.AAC.2
MLPLFPYFPFDSAERVRVQPAAELGHIQRPNHGRHVLGALRSRVHPALCLRNRRPTPSRSMISAPLR